MPHPVISVFDEMQETVESKAADYAASSNVFENFEFAARIAGISVEQQFSALIGTKVARLMNLDRGLVANHESVEDTLIDLANYAALRVAYGRSRDA